MAPDSESPQRIAQKLSRSPSKESTDLRAPRLYAFGPFTLDVRRRRLLRGAERIFLAPKAFDTLLLLVERRGELVEKDELMQSLWPDVAVEEANLTQNVFTVRKALGDTSEEHQYIETLPRRGYRLAAAVRAIDGDLAKDQESVAEIAPGPTLERTGRAWLPSEQRQGERVPAFRTVLVLLLTVGSILLVGLSGGFRGDFGADSGEPVAPAEVVHFQVPLPAGARFARAVPQLAISHDGRQLVFVAERPGVPPRLFVRPLDAPVVRELQGTDGADSPFWSPDDRFIGFFAQGNLRKVAVAGGAPQTLANAPGNWGGTWGRDQTILYSRGPGYGLWKVSALGGTPEQATDASPSRGDLHAWPSFLADGRRFVHFGRSEAGRHGIYQRSLDSKEATFLVEASSTAAAEPGYLVLVREGSLVAMPFDDRLARVRPDAAVTIAEEVGHNVTFGNAAFALSSTGVLAYWRLPKPAGGQLAWFDRGGIQEQTVGAPGSFYSPSLSPDGRRVAVTRFGSAETADIWAIEPGRGAMKFTTHPASEIDPIWSPDGDEIVFASDRSGPFDLYRRSAGGEGQDELLLTSGRSKFPTSWSTDAEIIVFEVSDAKTALDLWTLRRSDGHPERYLATQFNEENGALSPDGRWMAYQSDESGTWEVYVRSFPDAAGPRYLLSSAGGTRPKWRRDMRELYYLDPDARLMVVPLGAGVPGGREAALGADVPSALFAAPSSPQRILFEGDYAVSADGQRFLFHVPSRSDAPPALDVVLYWNTLLASRLTRQ